MECGLNKFYLAIAVGLIVLIELGSSVPTYGLTTTIFADDFSGTQLSSSWTVSTALTPLTNPATATVANGLLTLNSTGPSANFLDVSVPFTPSGNNLSVTTRVRADNFGRFHLALLTQAGTFDPGSVAAAFEFDMTGSLPGDCGNMGAAIDRVGGSYGVFSCNVSPGTWYQFQIVATNNPFNVTWNYLNDSVGVIASKSVAGNAYSFSSIKYLALGVWANSAESTSSTYDVDWIIASSPSPGAVHTGSSGSTSLVVRPRNTSTIVNCAPGSVRPGQTTTCTSRVIDTGSGTPITPTGTVSWTSTGPGSFNTTACSLSGSGASASCSVKYTPTASGAQVITATYGGDPAQPVSALAALTVMGDTLLDSWMVGLVGSVGAVGVGAGIVVLLTRVRKPKP